MRPRRSLSAPVKCCQPGRLPFSHPAGSCNTWLVKTYSAKLIPPRAILIRQIAVSSSSNPPKKSDKLHASVDPRAEIFRVLFRVRDGGGADKEASFRPEGDIIARDAETDTLETGSADPGVSGNFIGAVRILKPKTGFKWLRSNRTATNGEMLEGDCGQSVGRTTDNLPA